MTTVAAVLPLLTLWLTSYVCENTPGEQERSRPSKSGPCDQCRFEHGVGYMPAPGDCSRYLLCRLNDQGLPEVAATMSCALGLFWNQELLTCDYAANVDCPYDVCDGKTQHKPHPGSCRKFWDCSSRRGVLQFCPPGKAFAAAAHKCDDDHSCSQTCHDPVSACEPWLMHTFTNDTEVSDIYIANYGVYFNNGEAHFEGSSKLLINYFSNVFWGSEVFIGFQFRLQNAPTGTVCLLTNGDCSDTASIAIRAKTTGVEFFVDTEQSPPVSITVPYFGNPTTTDQTVLFNLANDKLTGWVFPAFKSQAAIGNVETRHCGLVIGGGAGCQGLQGTMDYLFVSNCDPTQ